MTILAFGRTGQVGRELARLGLTPLDRAAADLADPAACAEVIARSDARAVINAAAYTAVDAAEEEEAQATIINGAAPGAMAQACAARDIPFVHVSTDYVFDGSGSDARAPDAPTAPLGAYGRSKRVGEEAVLAAGGVHVILRTSWVFSAHGKNFARTMLKFGAERESLRVVADQIGGPTPARAIAEACITIAEALCADPTKAGIYHFAGAPDVSWAGFASAIMEEAGLGAAIEEIPTTDWPTPAARPLNSRLDCSTTEEVFGIARPDWRAGLVEILADLSAG